MILNNNIEK